MKPEWKNDQRRHLDLLYVACFNPVVDLWLEKTASRKHPET